MKYLSQHRKLLESKNCTQCNIEKHINKVYRKYSVCKDCNSKRQLKRYEESKAKISIQQKNYYEKNRENYYRNKIRDIKILKKYLDPMLK